VDQLIHGRSPSLDLDSLYGRGPADDPQFFTDGLHLQVGRTANSETIATQPDPIPRQPRTRHARGR
jgi:hypothetical protein